jgi:formylmethanofuran dehydrogenase subunit A
VKYIFDNERGTVTRCMGTVTRCIFFHDYPRNSVFLFTICRIFGYLMSDSVRHRIVLKLSIFFQEQQKMNTTIRTFDIDSPIILQSHPVTRETQPKTRNRSKSQVLVMPVSLRRATCLYWCLPVSAIFF